ncbi:uncharacterized protein Tco025E_08279, partial [Trypanosoma conorhini]
MHFFRAMRRPRRTAPLLPLALLLLLLLCVAAGCLAEAPAKVAQEGDASQDGVTSGTPKDPSSEDNQLSAGSGAGTEKGPEEAGTAKAPESPDLSGTDGQEPALPPAPAPQADNKAVLPTAGAESEETRRGVDAGSLSTKAKDAVEGKGPGQENSQGGQVQVAKEEEQHDRQEGEEEPEEDEEDAGEEEEVIPSTTPAVAEEGGIPEATPLPSPSVGVPAAGDPTAQTSGGGAGTGSMQPDVAGAPKGSAGEAAAQATANNTNRNTATATDSKQGSGVAGVSPTPGDSARVREPQGTRAESAPPRPAGEPQTPQRRHGQRKHRRKPKATRAQPKLCKHMGSRSCRRECAGRRQCG